MELRFKFSTPENLLFTFDKTSKYRFSDRKRIWNAFLGCRNTIVTSRLRLKVYDVDFGIDVPTFVDAFMPDMDGCVHIMENGNASDRKPDNWYDETVSIYLYLRTDTMKKLLDDPELRKYRKNS